MFLFGVTCCTISSKSMCLPSCDFGNKLYSHHTTASATIKKSYHDDSNNLAQNPL